MNAVNAVIENGCEYGAQPENTACGLLAQKYSVKDIALLIKCPPLVCEAENDDLFPGQPKYVLGNLANELS